MIAIQDIAFVRYQVTDLDAMQQFLVDFGLHPVANTGQALYMRGAGSTHHIHISERGETNKPIGYGLLAQSEADLKAIAAKLGSKVEPNPEPGGGQRVRFKDPAAFVVDVIHGQVRHEPMPVRASFAVNATDKHARVGRTIRARPAPSHVMRLGHVAMLVPNFPETLAFYRDLLGFRVSDTYWAGVEGNTIAAFLHCGLGERWTDHHTVALVSSDESTARFDHSAFEVLDLDDVQLGGEHLRTRGHQHTWGVGRHVQGSQIFDYWRDPFGNKIEHWTDGDLVNDSTPTGHNQITDNELSQWAPPLNPEFFT